ncbi:hypothetical protein F383_29367 [Gossypium arboreum]|uniref:Uncharacterized protein n=1 Tax=Gossypium arboreum TaxID=29729 RepID=A0A0B0PFH7_GOSAR|nr:hypothetical protein F383_29367 [Gossypium arboreum]
MCKKEKSPKKSNVKTRRKIIEWKQKHCD